MGVFWKPRRGDIVGMLLGFASAGSRVVARDFGCRMPPLRGFRILTSKPVADATG